MLSCIRTTQLKSLSSFCFNLQSRRFLFLFLTSSLATIIVSRYLLTKYYPSSRTQKPSYCSLTCFVLQNLKKSFLSLRNQFFIKLLGMPSNNNMHARRPPSFEGWEVDLVNELNDVVDLYALSRDMPRLKVSSPSRHSVRNEAWTLNKDQKEEKDSHKQEEADSSKESLGDKAFKQQLEEKADRMCAALLHLEELVNAATSSNRSNIHSNAPDGASSPSASSSSPLRTNSVKMYPKFAKDADLSSAFLSLLRETHWLPTEQEEVETSQSTGKSRGKIPCDKLLPQVRILGTMAQTVIFAPSRRIAHLMWHPDYSTNLMDCDWEVFLMDHPWPNSSRRSSPRKKISKNKKNTTAPNEKSPLLSGNGNNQINDDDENDDNNEDEDLVTNHENDDNERPVTPSTQIQVRQDNTNDDDETNENDQAKNNGSTDDHNEMIYVCHRIISRNVIAPENINRHPRFQIHWVLELQCGKVTGVMKRAKISGVRVRLMDDEAAVDAAASCGGCCSSCGAAAEWRDLRDELEERVERNFGVELERAKDADPF